MLRQCEAVYRERVWEWAEVLLIGGILTPGERTGAAILPVLGCSEDKPFPNDHRGPGRATWSNRERSRLWLVLLVHLLVPGNEPMILGMDETIERRGGRQMAAQAVSRDPVRSSKELLGKTTGLRWIAFS
ncbi:MAG TPA: hypothetical protein VGF67_28920 [Ktedonobacteraceae bacterium]